MILTKKSDGFPKILFASLPLLFQVPHFSNACFLGALICAAFWVTAIFFERAFVLFPKPLFKTALLLWLAALAQMTWYYWDLKPYWIVSLALLVWNIPFGKEGRAVPFRFLFLHGLGFWMVLAYIGIFQDILGGRFSLVLFQQVPGAFFLLGFLALIWQLKPKGQNA